MAKYKAYNIRNGQRNKTIPTSRRTVRSDDAVVRSTYALYTEIINREKNEIDNAVFTLQRIRASSSK